jgi:hypothetical protein
MQKIKMVETSDDSEPNYAILETAEEISTREGIYGEIKRLLIARGIPADEIAFIHDFATPAKKAQAFADVNAGRIRVMIASTEKAGTGVNMQQRLYALHHLDTPWRPSDVEQREGRILRQGNLHKEVHLCQYITEGSFDGYMWQTLESKSRFISQIMAGEVTARTAEDVDQLVMNAAQIKAIASGNPLILEKVAAEVELTKLERIYSVWRANRRRLRSQQESLPADLEQLARTIGSYQQAINTRENNDEFQLRLVKNLSSDELLLFRDRQRAAAHLRQLISQLAQASGRRTIGNYRGFEIVAQNSGRATGLHTIFTPTELALRVREGEQLFPINLGESDLGILQSMDAQLRGLELRLEQASNTERELLHRQAQIQTELNKGWEHANRYEKCKEKLEALNAQFTRTGQEVEATLEVPKLDADAFLPVEVVKVRQLVSVREDQMTESAMTSGACEVTEMSAPEVIEEMPTGVIPPVQIHPEYYDEELKILSELPQQKTKKSSSVKLRAANSQQMSFGWL